MSAAALGSHSPSVHAGAEAAATTRPRRSSGGSTGRSLRSSSSNSSIASAPHSHSLAHLVERISISAGDRVDRLAREIRDLLEGPPFEYLQVDDLALFGRQGADR